MIIVRCKECNSELTSHQSKTQCCGCPNMMTIRGDKVSAIDLTKVVMVNSVRKESSKAVLSSEDLAFQEERKKRKVRKLDFEIR
jgi:hypothetical protein